MDSRAKPRAVVAETGFQAPESLQISRILFQERIDITPIHLVLPPTQEQSTIGALVMLRARYTHQRGIIQLLLCEGSKQPIRHAPPDITRKSSSRRPTRWKSSTRTFRV